MALLNEILVNYRVYFSGLIRRVPIVFAAFPFLFLFSILTFLLYRHKPGVKVIGLLVGYFILVHLLFSFESRYLVPILPLLAILASMSIGYFNFFLGKIPVLDEILNSKLVLFIPIVIIIAIYFLSIVLLARETLKSGLNPRGYDAIETLSPVFVCGNPKQLARYYNRSGVLELFLKHSEKAKQKFFMAIAEDPNYPDAHLNLAYAYRLLGNDEKAFQVCRDMEKKLLPSYPYMLTILTDLLECQEISLRNMNKERQANNIKKRRQKLENKLDFELL